MEQTTDIRSLLRHMFRANEFLDWLRKDGDALIAAADLLGGPRWENRASAVVHAARSGKDIQAHRRSLRSLHRLLRLRFVTDPARREAIRCVMINPSDTRADNAALCAKALDRGLRALEALRLAGIDVVEVAR